jgi:hypothetical protein
VKTDEKSCKSGPHRVGDFFAESAVDNHVQCVNGGEGVDAFVVTLHANVRHQVNQGLEIVIQAQVLFLLVVLIEFLDWNLNQESNWLRTPLSVNNSVVLDVYVVSSIFTRNEAKKFSLLFRLGPFRVKDN